MRLESETDSELKVHYAADKASMYCGAGAEACSYANVTSVGDVLLGCSGAGTSLCTGMSMNQSSAVWREHGSVWRAGRLYLRAARSVHVRQAGARAPAAHNEESETALQCVG